MNSTEKYKDIILRSHERSVRYGVEKDRPGPNHILKGAELNSVLEENEELIEIAKPFMEILYDVLRESGFSIYLTDRSGIVLTIIGDEAVVEGQKKAGIIVGADMSEKSSGTNSMGAALHEDCSIQTSGEDHYITAFYIWTCSAAVIHDEIGDMIGCLNLTGWRQSAHPHTLGLVVAAVKSIEHQLTAEKAETELKGTYEYLNTVMDSMNSGFFAADTNGVVKSVNNSLCRMLEIEKEDILQKKAYKLLENWEWILAQLKEKNAFENREIIYFGNQKKNRFDLSVYP